MKIQPPKAAAVLWLVGAGIGLARFLWLAWAMVYYFLPISVTGSGIGIIGGDDLPTAVYLNVFLRFLPYLPIVLLCLTVPVLLTVTAIRALTGRKIGFRLNTVLLVLSILATVNIIPPQVTAIPTFMLFRFSPFGLNLAGTPIYVVATTAFAPGKIALILVALASARVYILLGGAKTGSLYLHQKSVVCGMTGLSLLLTVPDTSVGLGARQLVFLQGTDAVALWRYLTNTLLVNLLQVGLPLGCGIALLVLLLRTLSGHPRKKVFHGLLLAFGAVMLVIPLAYFIWQIYNRIGPEKYVFPPRIYERAYTGNTGTAFYMAVAGAFIVISGILYFIDGAKTRGLNQPD